MDKRFFVLRHGLTEKPGVLLGQFNAQLSTHGRRQARELAEQLANERIERIVSSALARAHQTAAEIAQRLALDVEAEERLNEISYGRWDGMTWEQIEQLDREVAARKLKDWWSATPPGGEPAAEFARRVGQAWRSLFDHPAATTLVVAHEAVNAVLLDLAQWQPSCENEGWQPNWKRISGFKQQPGAYHKLTVRGK